MRLVDIDKVKKHLDENKPDWTAEDYAVACEDAEFYSSLDAAARTAGKGGRR